MLSGAGADDAGGRDCHFAADFADGGSGGGTQKRGRSSGVPQQLTHPAPDGTRHAACAAGGVQNHLRRPGAPRNALVSGDGAIHADFSACRGRGALCLPVGAGFPPGVSAYRGFRRFAAHPPGHGRIHRDRNRARPARHHPPIAPAQPGDGHDRLRPPEPLLRGHPPQEPRRCPHGYSPPETRRKRHRLLCDAQGSRAGLRQADSRGHRRDALSRGTKRRGAQGESGEISVRHLPGDGRDERVRHGHRQIQRAVCHPLPNAALDGGVLSGGRARRTRRRGGGVHPAVQRVGHFHREVDD